ncbi:MAG: PIN domain-containing protein [Propionibacteriaceae bacterium]|jgi:predicted nucleic acid-binding protein|nr:PIN domain-containing protein [Propionibacteriaceae bacterium]
MGRALILDTGVLVAYERGKLDLATVGDPDDDIAIAAITVAEFRVDIENDPTTARAKSRERLLNLLLQSVYVLDYTVNTAALHAKLLAHTRKTGTARGPIDLIIAAHAAETGRILVSLDAKAKFADLPGIASRTVVSS